MKHPKEFDTSLTSLVAKLPERICPVMVFATAIATFISITAIFIMMIIFCWLTHNYTLLKSVCLGIALAPLAELSKFITRRKRPETLYVERMKFKTYSFPSGHAYISALVFGFLAVHLASAFAFGFVISVLLTFLVFLVGISRVYLGAHFPSDVLAGWALGCAVLVFWLNISF